MFIKDLVGISDNHPLLNNICPYGDWENNYDGDWSNYDISISCKCDDCNYIIPQKYMKYEIIKNFEGNNN